jgi:broad specificity phosphatase PhoE
VKVLFTLPAKTIYDAQSRVMGHRSTPASREELRKLKDLAPRLKELGAEKVVCSDLDGQSGFLLARTLGVQCEEWKPLRRFNVGKHHGQRREKEEKILAEYQERWKTNPNIPYFGGDSWTSFKNRLASAKDRLKKNGVVYAVVAPPMVIEQLTGARQQAFEEGHIYAWEE